MCATVVLLVRYGELSLKSRYVRRQLEDRLVTNVQEMFAANRTECIVKVARGRLFVHADDEVAALRLVRRVFGIVSVSAAKEVPSDLDTLTKEVVAYAGPLLGAGRSFAIRPRRSGTHPYTSQDLARILGKAMQDAIPGLAVRLAKPDIEVHVEVRGPRAYVFHEIVDGVGGLPLGSQGAALAHVGDEAGMVAAWLMMRRGCRVRVAGSEPSLNALRQWDPRLEVLGNISAEDLSHRAADKGIPLVWPTDARPTAATTKLFVLDPLTGLSDDEVRDLARLVRETQVPTAMPS